MAQARRTAGPEQEREEGYSRDDLAKERRCAVYRKRPES
jgi:hypothetical protein